MQLRYNEAFPGIGVAYELPPEDLRAFVSTISYICVEPQAGLVADLIYPEWGNVRFTCNGRMALRTGPGPLEECTPSGGIGPTSHATRFTLAPGRYWSISLTPLGWARFVGIPASQLAEQWQPVAEDTAFHRFAPIHEIVNSEEPDSVVAAIGAHLSQLPPIERAAEARIVLAHAALVDPEITAVSELATRLELVPRTLERLSSAVFGFTPKLLMRRQRFLRSLSLYMLDPSLSWIETLDTEYFDQAHFIRDFRRFMDMTPGQYARMPHPVMWAAAQARVAKAGTAMQVLQAP